MKSIFDEREIKARIDDEKKRGSSSMPIVLWMVAMFFVAGVASVYLWVEKRPAIEPPPPPVTLEDTKQTSAAIGKFNKFVEDDKWDEAEKMLSTSAIQYLKDQNKSLRESILGARKDERVFEAAPTPSIERAVDSVRQDCVYKFMDGQFTIVPLTLKIENEKIVIDRWWEDGSETKEPVIK